MEPDELKGISIAEPGTASIVVKVQNAPERASLFNACSIDVATIEEPMVEPYTEAIWTSSQGFLWSMPSQVKVGETFTDVANEISITTLSVTEVDIGISTSFKILPLSPASTTTYGLMLI